MDDDVFQEKADEEFDEPVFGETASNQPLTLRVRRIRNLGVVVIYWEVANWQGWENPIVFGRQYKNHIPTNMVNENETENPSTPIISGSVQRVGTTGELKLAAGQTTYFGFWLKGRTMPKPKGLEWPEWVEWSSPEPITFPVYMPLWAESLEALRERRDKEHIKRDIRNVLRAQEEKPRAEQEKRKRDPVMAGLRQRMEDADKLEELLKYSQEVVEKEKAQLAAIDERLTQGEITEEQAEDLRHLTEQVYSNIRTRPRNASATSP